MGEFKFEVSMFVPENQDTQELFDEVTATCERFGDDVEIEEV